VDAVTKGEFPNFAEDRIPVVQPAASLLSELSINCVPDLTCEPPGRNFQNTEARLEAPTPSAGILVPAAGDGPESEMKSAAVPYSLGIYLFLFTGLQSFSV
jgi:hypothetical protein